MNVDLKVAAIVSRGIWSCRNSSGPGEFLNGECMHVLWKMNNHEWSRHLTIALHLSGFIPSLILAAT